MSSFPDFLDTFYPILSGAGCSKNFRNILYFPEKMVSCNGNWQEEDENWTFGNRMS